MTFNILCLDGGGVRSVIQVILLSRIIERFPGFLDSTNMICGTSAGGLLALSIAKCGTLEVAMKLMNKENLCSIFKSGGIVQEIQSFWGVVGPRYDNSYLKQLLEKEFQGQKLSELSKQVMVTSFKLSDNKENSGKDSNQIGPCLFSNLSFSTNKEERVVKAALATTAAPSYFPVYEGYIDGGVFANNPSLVGVVIAKKMGISIEDIRVFSLGTGEFPAREESGNWGVLQWSYFFLNVVLAATMSAIDDQCKELLGNQYLRVNLPMERNIHLNDCGAIDFLMEKARLLPIESFLPWIETHWTHTSTR